ncbi:MAG: LuxR C-terminal-related transcriptional regulator [Acidimicrobiia bacterium]
MTSSEAIATGAPAPQLLATKLHAPRQRREAVHRARLNHRLVPARQPALTLVSAPAGFGKTTLLTDCFADSDRSTSSIAWVELDAGDNDPATFGSYVVAALQSLSPQVGENAAPLLRSHGLQAAMATLINDLEGLDEHIVLVLDDYHVIDTNDVHQAITFLVDHASPHFHLVLASRADPPLPLAQWRARGELLEIRAADLRFTNDEASSYLNDAMGLDLSTGSVGALETRTEGWIAALQLAALSLQGRDDVAGFIENFTGDDRFVVDYLAEEVLERQPESIRTFLLQTSVLNRLTGSLCDAVTGESGGKSTLEMLDRANLFVVPLDDRRHWYRYHHLFADVLRARLLDEHAGRASEIHLQASTWYERHGDIVEAIEQAIAGHHHERAARLLEFAVPTVRQSRQDATFRRWLEALPDELFDARPVLTIALVGARMATGDPKGVEMLLDRVDRWLDAPAAGGRGDSAATPIVFDHDEFARLPAHVATYRAALALLAGDTVGTISHATRALALAEPSDHLRRGAAAALTGLAHWSVGDLDQACSRYSEAADSFVEANYIPDLLGVSLGLADIQIAQGRLRDARRTYETALAHAAGQPGLRGTADMHVGLSELLIELNDLDAAASQLHTSSALGEQAGLPQHPYRWRLATARLRHAQGDFEEALDLLDHAERVYNTDFSPAIQPITAVKARVQLAQGDITSALKWAADRRVAIDDDLTYLREYEHITLARTLIAEAGTRPPNDATIGFLERLLDSAQRGHRQRSVIEILVLLAMTYEARGDRQAATTALDQALVLAKPEGYVRLFLDTGPALVGLMQSAQLNDDATQLARRLLATTTPIPAMAPARRALVDELSSRELDVLRLLRSDLSGPEIARELHVSLNTLRTHTKSIYTKLGATNRREAIRLATEHGL